MNIKPLLLFVVSIFNGPFFLSGKWVNNNSWKVEFEENFSQLPPQSEPESLFILDGSFLINENKDGKELKLSGSPVGDFGFMFGPRVREKAMELNFTFLDDILITEKGLPWESDKWWKSRFQVIPLKPNKNLLRLKIWPRDSEEPKTWLVEHTDNVLFQGGKCVIWGYPYAGTPIHYDDIKILSLEKE